MDSQRGQLSFEYLYVIGFLLVVLTPLIYYSFDSSSDEIRRERFAGSLASLENGVKTVYALGPNNVQKVRLDLPNGIENITISGKEVNIRATIEGEISDFHFTTPINVTGSIENKQGTHVVRIEYMPNGEINITG